MGKRSYTKEEFARILATARTFQTQDLILEGIAAQDEVDLETICSMAEREGILPEYVEKARKIFYPDFQERLKLVDEGAINLDIKFVIKLYCDELLEQLRFIAPKQEFNTDINNDKNWAEKFNLAAVYQKLNFSRIEKSFGILLERKVEIKLARFEFYHKCEYQKKSFELKVYLVDDFFMRACGEKLNEINDYFRGKDDFHLDCYHVYFG